MISFKGKVAIITGSSHGIGKAAAIDFAKNGASVVICARNEVELKKVEKEIKNLGGNVFSKVIDMSHEKEVKLLINETVEHFGKLDIMVCNAGVKSTIPFFEIDDQEWYRVLDINLKGTFYCCRESMRQMKLQGYGKIVTVSSKAGQVGAVLANIPYSASKAGIIVMTKCAAKIMAPYNINVNCVAPGTVDTPFISDFDNDKRKLLMNLIPLGRLGKSTDISPIILFLSSDQANWVTGAVFNVNGGEVM